MPPVVLQQKVYNSCSKLESESDQTSRPNSLQDYRTEEHEAREMRL